MALQALLLKFSVLRERSGADACACAERQERENDYRLIPRTSRTRWEQVGGHDVQLWLVHLLAPYSDAYASNQYRALQQFFRWLAAGEELRDPMASRRAPKVPGSWCRCSPAENRRP